MSEKNINNINDVYENYILKYIEKKKFKINYFNNLNINSKPDKTWILYFKDITNEKFEIPRLFDNYKIQRKVSTQPIGFNLIRKIKK